MGTKSTPVTSCSTVAMAVSLIVVLAFVVTLHPAPEVV
jgi:hypothetical protein